MRRMYRKFLSYTERCVQEQCLEKSTYMESNIKSAYEPQKPKPINHNYWEKDTPNVFGDRRSPYEPKRIKIKKRSRGPGSAYEPARIR